MFEIQPENSMPLIGCCDLFRERNSQSENIHGFPSSYVIRMKVFEGISCAPRRNDYSAQKQTPVFLDYNQIKEESHYSLIALAIHVVLSTNFTRETLKGSSIVKLIKLGVIKFVVIFGMTSAGAYPGFHSMK